MGSRKDPFLGPLRASYDQASASVSGLVDGAGPPDWGFAPEFGSVRSPVDARSSGTSVLILRYGRYDSAIRPEQLLHLDQDAPRVCFRCFLDPCRFRKGIRSELLKCA